MKLPLLWLGLGACLLWSSTPGMAQAGKAETGSRQVGARDTPYRGGLVTPPLPKPAFTLIDTSGTRFDIKAETEGFVTLLFFGYTHCAVVCPTQMAYLAGALRKLPKEVSERFKVVFVSTDSAHDNPRLLRVWLDHFDKNFIGLTGTEAEVRAAQIAANVPFTPGSPAEHSAFVLVYTKDDLGHVIYPAGVTQADWLHDLPQLAKEGWTTR